MIRSPLVECRRKVATLFQVVQMQSASATDILDAQGTRHKGAIDCKANLETGLVAGSQAGGSWEQGDPILSERDPDPATTASLIRVSGWTRDQRGITTTAQQHTAQTEMQKHKSSCCTSAPQTNCKAITMNSKRSLF